MQDNGTTLTAREILRLEYGDSRNFLTPHVIARGKLRADTAYELSSGEGITPGTRLYGVSVVVVHASTTERDYESSCCFSSLQAANEYVEELRRGCDMCGRAVRALNAFGYLPHVVYDRVCDECTDDLAGAVARDGLAIPEDDPSWYLRWERRSWRGPAVEVLPSYVANAVNSESVERG